MGRNDAQPILTVIQSSGNGASGGGSGDGSGVSGTCAGYDRPTSRPRSARAFSAINASATLTADQHAISRSRNAPRTPPRCPPAHALYDSSRTAHSGVPLGFSHSAAATAAAFAPHLTRSHALSSRRCSTPFLRSVASTRAFEESDERNQFEFFSESYDGFRHPSLPYVTKKVEKDPRWRIENTNPTLSPPTPRGSVKRHARRLQLFIESLLGVSTPAPFVEAPRCPTTPSLVGAVLFGVTVVVGVVYFGLHATIVGCQVGNCGANSGNTRKTTALEAAVDIGFCLYGTLLGVYANRFARRLAKNHRLIDSVGLWSKSVAKVVICLILLIAAFIAADAYDRFASNETDILAQGSGAEGGQLCESLGLPKLVCSFEAYTRLANAALAGLWNLLALAAVLSVCRSKSTAIRRFAKELEEEEQSGEARRRGEIPNANAFPVYTIDANRNVVSDDDDDDDDESDDDDQLHLIRSEAEVWRERIGDDRVDRGGSNNSKYDSRNINSSVVDGDDRIDGEEEELDEILYQSYQICDSAKTSPQLRRRQSLERHDAIDDAGVVDRSRSLSCILSRHWNLDRRLRRAGNALQRWMAAATLFVFAWTTRGFAGWAVGGTRAAEIFTLFLPLLLLALVSFSVARVNQDGGRLARRIRPTPDRLRLAAHLTRHPLRLEFYGETIGYRAVGVATAIVVLATMGVIVAQKFDAK